VLCATKRTERGIEELERGLAIDPNLAGAHAAKGWAKIVSGRAEEAEAHLMEALRLSPHDTSIYMWFHFVGMAKAYLSEFTQALTWLRKSIDSNRNWPWGFFLLAACLGHLGRFDEAHREAEAGLKVFPKFTLHRFRMGAQSHNPIHLGQRERVLEGMRMAGLPEE
jgi:tetratricopeptide (TPR) repeat protein